MVAPSASSRRRVKTTKTAAGHRPASALRAGKPLLVPGQDRAPEKSCMRLLASYNVFRYGNHQQGCGAAHVRNAREVSADDARRASPQQANSEISAEPRLHSLAQPVV